jgi:hypothetical protein
MQRSEGYRYSITLSARASSEVAGGEQAHRLLRTSPRWR